MPVANKGENTGLTVLNVYYPATKGDRTDVC